MSEQAENASVPSGPGTQLDVTDADRAFARTLADVIRTGLDGYFDIREFHLMPDPDDGVQMIVTETGNNAASGGYAPGRCILHVWPGD